MKKKMVSMKLADLPPLTKADHIRLAKLAARPDHEIDLSDIPELTDDELKTAVRGKTVFVPVCRRFHSTKTQK